MLPSRCSMTHDGRTSYGWERGARSGCNTGCSHSTSAEFTDRSARRSVRACRGQRGARHPHDVSPLPSGRARPMFPSCPAQLVVCAYCVRRGGWFAARLIRWRSSRLLQPPRVFGAYFVRRCGWFAARLIRCAHLGSSNHRVLFRVLGLWVCWMGGLRLLPAQELGLGGVWRPDSRLKARGSLRSKST